MGVGNLAHFLHKIALFINSRGLKPEQGAEPPWRPHFNHCRQGNSVGRDDSWSRTRVC